MATHIPKFSMTVSQIVAMTREWPLFPPDERGLYHIVNSLIISQRVRFVVGRRIRALIYSELGETKLDRVLTLTEKQRQRVGMHESKWCIIQDFDTAWRKDEFCLKDIKGIGPWTVQCARIMVGDYSVGFISGDLAVRKLLGKLLGTAKILTSRKCDVLVQKLQTEEAGRLFSKLWNFTRSINYSGRVEILFTGSMIWTDEKTVSDTLDPQDHSILHGGCKKGLDAIVDRMAYDRGFRVHSHPTDWKRGRGAAFINNADMVNRNPVHIFAFCVNKSRGTMHCVECAEKRGIPVTLKNDI
uniref:DNA recombination-mediator protein A n=1 Tax=Marseillevirus LCMAC102 TaxID=2506603 RepID=A0A481YV38_9VIRU|nr:MAG: DNA recombination-mediator protein A [Marseillevirus LCMAC102]